MCAKDLIEAFNGVPDFDENDILHILHELGDGTDDATIDLIKFV